MKWQGLGLTVLQAACVYAVEGIMGSGLLDINARAVSFRLGVGILIWGSGARGVQVHATGFWDLRC